MRSYHCETIAAACASSAAAIPWFGVRSVTARWFRDSTPSDSCVQL
jgi:hypothetical protein